MRKGLWAACAATVAALAGAAPAQAGTYDVVSCGAPGARGVNHAWRALAFHDQFWNVTPSCPALTVTSEPSGATTVPNWDSAGFELVAPAGALLDRLTIWRFGYRFNSTGDPQNTWHVQGYNADSTVIGGAFGGETCLLTTGILNCQFGANTPMSPASRADRDLETARVFYSAACFNPPGCVSANAQGFPFAGLSIHGSVATVRESAPPAVIARGPLLAGGWQTTDAPLSFGASDPVGIKLVRVLVDGREVRTVKPACDYTYMAPCAQAPERGVSLGDDLPDGHRTLRVEATDTAGNVTAHDSAVDVDRHGPDVAFVPSRGGRTIAVDVADAGSGVAGGTIELRRRHVFGALPTTVQGGRLVARLARGTRTGKTFRVTAVDAVGHQTQVVGAPVRLRAGFGRRYRSSTRGSLRRTTLVRGRLRATDGSPLAGRDITITSRLRVDGAAPAACRPGACSPRRGRRGRRAAWHASYRFGARAQGSYRIRARIRREGTLPFELGYSRPVTVRVG